MLMRITLTLVLILALAGAILLFPAQPMLPMIGTAVAVVLFAPIWFVGNRAVKESMQGAENLARLDREAKQLIEVITNTSNAVGFHTIGGETQDAIVASLRDLKAGKIKNKNSIQKIAYKTIISLCNITFDCTQKPTRLYRSHSKSAKKHEPK